MTIGSTQYNIYVVPDEIDRVENVELKVGEQKTCILEDTELNGSSEDAYARVEWIGTPSTITGGYATAAIGSNPVFVGETIDVAECLYTFTSTKYGSTSCYYVESKSLPGRYLNVNENAAGYSNAGVPAYILLSVNTSDHTCMLMNYWYDGCGTEYDHYLSFTRDGTNHFDRVE